MVLSEEVRTDICKRVAAGETIRKVCKELSIGSDSIYYDLAESEEFAKQYARAKEKQAETFAEEIMEIADDVDFEGESGNAAVQAARLRIDSRKWLLSKLLPRKYGDRQAVDLGNQDGKILKIEVTRVKGRTD